MDPAVWYMIGSVVATILLHRFGVVDLGSSGGTSAPTLPVPKVPVNPAHPVLSLLEQELLNVVKNVVSGLVVNPQAPVTSGRLPPFPAFPPAAAPPAAPAK